MVYSQTGVPTVTAAEEERRADESLYRSSVAVIKQLQRKLGKTKCPFCGIGEQYDPRCEVHAVR